jgi:hypothetical protein
VGAATLAYGATVVAAPELLARPSGLVQPDGAVNGQVATSLRPVAWRDAASGLAMLAAPAGPALALATGIRIAADLGDAALLGRALPSRRHRVMAVAVSVGWASLSVAGLLGRPRRALRQVAVGDEALGAAGVVGRGV